MFMRITMLSIGSIGDVRPYLLLGKELKNRGHQITMAAFPQFRDFITDSGLSFFPLDGDAEKMIFAIMQPDTNAFSYLPRLMKNIRRFIPVLLESMTQSCSQADAMICNFFGSIYYSIAELFDIPCIQINYFLVDPTGVSPIAAVRNQHLGKYANRSTYRIGYLLISLIEKHYLTPWRKEHHLDTRRISSAPDYSVGKHSVPALYAISPVLFPRPSEWGKNIYMSGFFFDESPDLFFPPEELVSFLSKQPAPVYIGFGSMNAGNMNKLITTILRAIRSADIRAVISLGHTGRKFRNTSRVFFLEGYIPHEWLFPRVSAVIHHGGAGTTATGLRFGIPTLVIPFAGDQTFWGNLVHVSGCGPKPIPRESLTVRRMTCALLDLVSRPDYAEHAGAIAERLAREHGVRNAADIIEKEITRWR